VKKLERRLYDHLRRQTRHKLLSPDMPFEAVAAATSEHETWKRLADESGDAGAVKRIVDRWVLCGGVQHFFLHQFPGGCSMKPNGRCRVRLKTVAAAAAGAEAGIERPKLMIATLQERGPETVTVCPGMFELTEAGTGGSGRAKQEKGWQCRLFGMQIINYLLCP
jgi:hypothetical protein